LSLETLSTTRMFGGAQSVCRHDSRETATPMEFGIFLPPQAEQGPCPVVWYLSGLTCTQANVTDKGQFQRVCAELGLIFVAPDTSPRGEGVPDDPQGAYDFGLGAGFYLNATQDPWAANYRMESYIGELAELVIREFPVDGARQGITGHSMGGHGALTLALKHPGQWNSVSAFAPIVAPMRAPWGQKALSGYLGDDQAAWRRHDATALIEDGARVPELFVDQGEADKFLDEQLKPHLLDEVCKAAGIPLTLRMQEGYDHGYGFVATFMEDHLRWHAERLA
jgi:S-formylglutathione hydrolase